jgi:DNA-binding NarL/FixJ family response regulator
LSRPAIRPCNGFGGARRALSGDFDIAVLDVATRSGLDTLREIRASSPLPVLMLTSNANRHCEHSQRRSARVSRGQHRCD